MARILKDLPLFSLIQVSPCLYEKIMEKMREKFPFLMERIRKIRAKDLEEAAREMNIVFAKPKKSRSTAAAAISVIETAITPALGVLKIEITLPQFYGEVSMVRKATQKVLGANGDFAEGRSGIVLNIILRDDDTPILTGQHGRNGNAQKFYVARKEISQ